MKKPVFLSTAAALVLAASPLAAQFEAPLPSPRAGVTQRVGRKHIDLAAKGIDGHAGQDRWLETTGSSQAHPSA